MRFDDWGERRDGLIGRNDLVGAARRFDRADACGADGGFWYLLSLEKVKSKLRARLRGAM